jgi:hypothetical protein
MERRAGESRAGATGAVVARDRAEQIKEEEGRRRGRRRQVRPRCQQLREKEKKKGRWAAAGVR